MSTRGMIIMPVDGKIARVGITSDAYPDYMGRQLMGKSEQWVLKAARAPYVTERVGNDWGVDDFQMSDCLHHRIIKLDTDDEAWDDPGDNFWSAMEYLWYFDRVKGEWDCLDEDEIRTPGMVRGVIDLLTKADIGDIRLDESHTPRHIIGADWATRKRHYTDEALKMIDDIPVDLIRIKDFLTNENNGRNSAEKARICKAVVSSAHEAIGGLDSSIDRDFQDYKHVRQS